MVKGEVQHPRLQFYLMSFEEVNFYLTLRNVCMLIDGIWEQGPEDLLITPAPVKVIICYEILPTAFDLGAILALEDEHEIWNMEL
jgi:hypothetical protein